MLTLAIVTGTVNTISVILHVFFVNNQLLKKSFWYTINLNGMDQNQAGNFSGLIQLQTVAIKVISRHHCQESAL